MGGGAARLPSTHQRLDFTESRTQDFDGDSLNVSICEPFFWNDSTFLESSIFWPADFSARPLPVFYSKKLRWWGG